MPFTQWLGIRTPFPDFIKVALEMPSGLVHAFLPIGRRHFQSLDTGPPSLPRHYAGSSLLQEPPSLAALSIAHIPYLKFGTKPDIAKQEIVTFDYP